MRYKILPLLLTAFFLLIVTGNSFLSVLAEDSTGDEYYLFDVTKHRLNYTSKQKDYLVEDQDNKKRLRILGKTTPDKSTSFNLNIESEFNILSVSPDEKFSAFFEHRQNYGTSILHILDNISGKVILKAENSIGDLHWLNNFAYFSRIDSFCEQDCSVKQYEVSLNKIDLGSLKISRVLVYGERLNYPATIEVVENHKASFVVSVKYPLQKDVKEFKAVNLARETITNFAAGNLIVNKIPGKSNPLALRVDASREDGTYAVFSTLDDSFFEKIAGPKLNF